MAATHDWECAVHGLFEAKGTEKKRPKCPRGCSSSLVELVYLKAPLIGNQRHKRGDQLVREMADMQGLSDISTSPSRPGGSVAHRNRMRMRGPSDRPDLQYPEFAAAEGGHVRGWKIPPVSEFVNAFPKQNAMNAVGLGHKYDANEWKTDPKTGVRRHLAAPAPIHTVPVGDTGVSVERVRGRRR